jgi:ATP-dependent DNA helicase RecG
MRNCKIVIRDEVNIKIEGLELTTRKRLSKKFKYLLPYARHMPAYKLGRWDGMISFFQMGGSTYLNLLPDILPVLQEERYEIEVADQRNNYGDLKLEKITEEYWGDTVWPAGHKHEGEPIRLRDDQVEAVNHFVDNLQSLQEISTGAGKCQPYDSKVLTDIGWKTMGNICVGDKVRTPDGSIASVLNVYEPGTKDVYEVTFKDGRTVRCCKDHIWPVYNIDWKNTKTGPIRNITTAQIIAQLENSNRPIGVPLATFENDTTDTDLPFDPWLLGFLLGDGSFRNKVI